MYRTTARSETLVSVQTVELIERRLGKNWAAISAARSTTNDQLSRLRSALTELGDPNYSIVVTGSLGRGEATNDSDADWMLLVDGLSNPDHAGLARTVAAEILKIVPKPVGPTGTFGEIVVSHDLIHYMAGTRDSNENLTRRILLLAESRALSNDIVRERVIRNILTRYVVYDRSVPSKSGKRSLVPHFLLNDVVRYWRTIASDYASKMWERNRAEWGMRNIKLRFSRKLLFLWGLIAAFSGELFPAPEVEAAATDDEYLRLLAEHVRAQTDVPPLELLARVVEQAGDDAIADAIFTSYDHFLKVLSNPDTCKKLKEVRFEDAVTDETFDDLRETSRTFREGVASLFFEKHPKLPNLIRKFGVF
jgi:predicted nucleotidyltransferase